MLQVSSLEVQSKNRWGVCTDPLHGAYSDFILSRMAMRCTPGTLRFYHYTAGKFVAWLQQHGVYNPSDICSRHVHAYLAELVSRELSDSYINGHARAIRTLVRYLHQEGYLPDLVMFEMPRIEQKRLLVLSVNELQQVLNSSLIIRDRLIILLLADSSGIRRAEACALNWGNVDAETGLIHIERGKGGKYRKVVIGNKTRQAMLDYQKTVSHNEDEPLIQTKMGTRLTLGGIQSTFMRISKRAGVKVTPHALRRTFATLSRRAGMDLVELQALMGHSSLEMTKKYIQMLDEDLLHAHQQHGPIDHHLNR